MKKQFKIVLSLIISISILVFIIQNVGISNLVNHFNNINYQWFTLSLLLFIPIFGLMAKRWIIVIDDCYKLKFWDSLKIVLSSTSLIAVTPSKLGDFSKAFFIKKKVPLKKGIGGVLFEKFLDVIVLCIFSLFGILLTWKSNAIYWSVLVICAGFLFSGLLLSMVKVRNTIFYPLFTKFSKKTKFHKFFNDLYDFLSDIKHNKKKFFKIFFLSLSYWFLQLSQIYIFFLSLNYYLNPLIVFGLVPIALFIGMIPITIAGVGTRDSALIFLFAAYAPNSLMLSIGILTSARLFLPALVGLLFLPRSIRKNF